MGRHFLQPLLARGASVGVNVELEVIEGIPASQIAAVTQRIEAELIVIGHRRRGLLQRFAEASVAKRVIDRVTCEVVVVPSHSAARQ